MARLRSPSDFVVEVEGIGKFTFARRKMADEIQIQRKYAEIAGGVEPTVWLSTLAEYLSTLEVLTVSAPADWDLDEMEPLENDTYKRLERVFVALREREERFLGRTPARREESREGDVPDSELLVPEQVQTDIE